MMYRLMLLLLVAGSLLFGAIIFIELTPAEADHALIAKAGGQPETTAATHRAQSPKLEELVATALARPLFISTRRPPQTDSAGAAGDSDLADKRLTGIVTAPGHRIAIFAVTGDKPLVVAEGEDVSGWRIESITPREVSLSGPSGSKTLQPKLDPSLAQSAPQPIVPNAAARPPIPQPGAPRPPVPPAAAAGRPSPAVPINNPGALPQPARARQR